MTLPDAAAFWLTLRLATISAIALLFIGAPIAWWLATTRARIKPIIETLIALPLVLPPTVIGFYLLVAFNPQTPLGGFWINLTGDTFAFTFTGLVVASVIYSLPFAVQPLQSAFQTVGRDAMETAASLGAAPLDAFVTVAVPLASRGFLTAGVLSFAHTLGEFGVALMVGGNIAGETRVVSIAIYENVETLRYGEAHALALILLLFSFFVLLIVYGANRRHPLYVR